MIKLLIFDLDGVLIDSKDIHYKALNEAICKHLGKNYVISYQQHINEYDGLPTKEKLKLLHKLHNEKLLSLEDFDNIYKEKQKITEELFEKSLLKDNYLIDLFKRLKKDFKIHIASNCIRKSTVQAIENLGLSKYVDFIISNEDVKKAKPHSEMYLKCMMDAGVNPKETIIIEDSYIGRKGAYNSGAYLLPVKNTNEVTFNNIQTKVNQILPVIKWQDNNLNIVIPMAGEGSRFKKVGYTFPKPLIDVDGVPMIERVINNLNIEANYIFIVRKEHVDKYNIDKMLKIINKNCKIIVLDHLTDGAACTILTAKKFINNKNPLLLVNSDQLIEWDSSACLYALSQNYIDGGIITFNSTHPKWSFAKVDENNLITEVAEKKPISNHATVGIYYWKYGEYFVECAEQMIEKNIRVNNEFYTCPVFNEAILKNYKIKNWHIEKMYGLGTPEDLNTYLTLQSKKV